NRAYRRISQRGERLREACRIAVDQKVYAALAVQDDILGAMFCDGRESEAFEELTQCASIGRRELQELDAFDRYRGLSRCRFAWVLHSSTGAIAALRRPNCGV